MNILRGDHTLIEKSLQDFVGTAFQVLVRFFVEIAMRADEFNQGFFVQCHAEALSVEGFFTFEVILPHCVRSYIFQI
jgi:hypothetical protein